MSLVVVDDQPSTTTIPPWVSPNKYIGLDDAAQKVCIAVATTLRRRKDLSVDDSMRIVLKFAHEFNERTSRAGRTLKALWKDLKALLPIREGLSFDVKACSGVPNIVTCEKCNSLEIAVYNNRTRRGQFTVKGTEVVGYCSICLRSNKLHLIKLTDHKTAEEHAHQIRVGTRRTNTAVADHLQKRHDKPRFGIPANEKRNLRLENQANAHMTVGR